MARTTTFSRNGDPSGPPQSQSQSQSPTTHTMNHYHDNPTTMTTNTTNTTSATATAAAVVEPSKISNILKAFQAATAVPLRGTISRNTNTNTTTTPKSPETSFSERGFQKFTTTRYATMIAFGVFLLYLILGTVVFAVWMEDWDAIDAAYFTVTTFTTVGYGDLYPITKGQRIFAMFFVTIGIMIIGGVVLGVVMNVLFAAFEKSLRSSTNRAQTTFLKKFQLRSRRRWSRSRIGSGGGGTTSHHGDDDDDDDDDNHEEEHPTRRSSCRRPSPTTIKSLIHNLGLAALVFVPGIVIGHFEQWALHESIYYSIITATTVGYGDLSPKNKWTRFAACFYLPLCVTIMASLFSKITSAYLDKKTREAEKEFFQRRLSHQDIQRMDLGGDGTVNPEEFLIFMLVNMGKVDEKSIQQIQALFRDLDKDGNGYLDAQDLLLMTYAVEEPPPNRDEAQPQDVMTRNVSAV